MFKCAINIFRVLPHRSTKTVIKIRTQRDFGDLVQPVHSKNKEIKLGV